MEDSFLVPKPVVLSSHRLHVDATNDSITDSNGAVQESNG